MTTTTYPTRAGAAGRPVIPATYLRIELIRQLRNPWTLGFSILMPALLYLLFGTSPQYRDHPLAHGTVGGLVLANMALYGAVVSATSVAASVSEERGNGWNRQLRLTPLRPVGYIGTKLLNALAVGAVVVAVTYAVGAATGAVLDPSAWAGTFPVAWLGGTALFTAFGLAVGYLFRGEAVLGVVGPLLALCAFFSGLFVPLEQLGAFMQEFARWTPMYGLRLLVEAPVTGKAIETAALVNAAVWFAIFAGVALWRYRRVAGSS